VTQVTKSDNEPHTRPDRDKSLITKYSLHAKQTILSDRAYLCKNFNFLLPMTSETSQQSNKHLHTLHGCDRTTDVKNLF